MSRRGTCHLVSLPASLHVVHVLVVKDAGEIINRGKQTLTAGTGMLSHMVPADIPSGQLPRAAGEPGSREDFLRFHREMIRAAFVGCCCISRRRITDIARGRDCQSSSTRYSENYSPDLCDPRLRARVNLPWAALSTRFIEVTAHIDFEGIHGFVHGIVSTFEQTMHGPQLVSYMGSLATAPLNEHFWGVHGWIDRFYAPGSTTTVKRSISHPCPARPMKCCNCDKLRKNSSFVEPGVRFREKVRQRSRNRVGRQKSQV
jgi:hypothetical protein